VLEKRNKFAGSENHSPHYLKKRGHFALCHEGQCSKERIRIKTAGSEKHSPH
jgi:hypothetical protein